MTLHSYRKKRNFNKTPEPPAHLSHTNGRLHFVVQKHAASHLHYDFRLESEGVLKSWAVPKGVSLDPHIRRLAMQVEDHPFDYRDFEGIIPPGNYGAGTVMVWDDGEYYVDKNLSKKENDQLIHEQLQKGHLNFYLNGKKLKGYFTLVRMKGKKGNEWLLIKKQDQFANQPIKQEDESVKTHRTLDEIAKKSDKIWKSNRKAKRTATVPSPPIPKAKSTITTKKTLDVKNIIGAVKTSMPKRIDPMLATLTSEPFDRAGWIFEVKWDGFRILSEIKDHKVRLYTRNDKTYDKNFPDVVKELKKLSVVDAIFDGEVVVVDEKGLSHFQLLQNYMRRPQGNLVYYIFDILYLNGYDLHNVALSKRKEILQALIKDSDIVRISQHVEEKGKAFYDVAKKNGLEGLIAKKLQSSYQLGQRSRDWLKIKTVQQQEAIICGFTQPRGSRKHFGALILGVYQNKELTYVGHTGGGFDYEGLKDLYQRLQPLITKECPFNVKPKTNAPVTWVKPQLLCEVKFQEWTHDGHMRQPIFLGMREDKRAGEVKKEVPKSTKEVLSKDKPKTSAKPLTQSNATASFDIKTNLTHLDKLYWPKEGYSKGDLINYYQQVSSFILPYLRKRPQSLRRQPNGIKDEGFFQKNINFELPKGIKTVAVDSDSRGVTHYILCENKEDLAYINNLGCIEMNPWSSTIDKRDYPDYLVLDFDPDNVPFPKLIKVVLAARGILERMEIPGFCKTSGSRGLHVNIPLKKKYTYEQAKDFSHLLCQAINKEVPELTSLERSPSKRKGQVYLDYLQNHYTATMACAYSVRPRPGATVSTPLEWAEVTPHLDPQKFTIKTMISRLEKKGDLWKGVLGPGINMKNALNRLIKLYP